MNTQDKDTAFLGQPRGLMTLFFTEMWERFSYYGMRAILIYYMYYAVTKGGLGFSQATAASVMAIYGSLVYLASVAGGFISDRILGSRKTVFYGGVLIMFGHIALSLPFGGAALLVSIALIVAGTGMLKPNVSEMVGSLYSVEDTRRDAGFSIFVFGINLGALLAPIIVSWVGFNMSFHAGFSLAAIGMFFGLVQYYIDGKKYLNKDSLYPSDPIQPDEVKKFSLRVLMGVIVLALILVVMFVANALTIDNVVLLISIIAVIAPIVYFIIMFSSSKVSKTERSRLWAYVPLFIAATLFWAIEEQGSVVLALFAADRTQLNYGWMHITPANFQSLNPLFIMLYTPIFAWLWTKLGKKQPSSPKKFTYGLVFTGLSYLFIALPGLMFGTDGKVNALWLVGSWAIVEIGEMLISPIGLSVTTKLAPAAFASQMMSMWFLADAAGQAINAQLVRFYPGHEVAYFIVLGLVTLVFALVLLICSPWITKKMQGIR
ncbi:MULTISPECIES: peptide MFS transporter [Pediococcus]|uniref:Di-/tripeptide transporter n=4 Tax=Pediococcus pentosaceus TaxID=1255 RepID=A0A0Q0Y562_PEDPE|nr:MULTISPECIES: peptide MFS transporter [Pediococcus]ABJ68562.1 Dipeptide/tripeptide permease [Pediococcus pentosaceus ATCC 25745]ANI97429.1 peptide ABC transporter permease [Pediococcus pentosaceus]ASC07924.1 Di-/tripeptide transporter [Pediococcus pentosaceus]AVL01995.1 MFS transporter [Pediococcus pentosaceus]AXR43997.1 peptide MFS transporter [Pediococcus pentosaceus]